MKMFIVFAILVAAALAANVPASDKKDQITVLRQENTVGVEGYSFGYETSDGTSRTENGELKNIGTDDEALSVHGSISWTAPGGQTFTLRYVADENGFQPEGEHLPK